MWIHNLGMVKCAFQFTSVAHTELSHLTNFTRWNPTTPAFLGEQKKKLYDPGPI
jgi:hypothetical protein